MAASASDLFYVQQGLCFLCGKPMRHFTREHVYPRATSGYRMENNIVLSHGPCNHKRGCTDPTEDEIQRATAIYAALGLKAFIFVPSMAARKRARAAERKAKSFRPGIITDCHGPEWDAKI